MYLLLSGEGSGDMGACYPTNDRCDRDGFAEGPMAIIVDQLVEHFQGFDMSHLEAERVSFVSEKYLADNKAPASRKAMALKGKKKPEETKYYYENARALATVAKAKSLEVDDQVVAVLFRDADGTASAGRGNWTNKHQSMQQGFSAEAFDFGVAMIPKPKSEAWLLCATKENPYQHCDRLENESGNDSAESSLKDQLATALSERTSGEQINELLRDGSINVFRIDMNSFNGFKGDLENVVKRVNGIPV
ncbi:hypothetical protein [Leucothrix mucor]|uniref:hypothetical protein n=1 Tax=Leucothrix mucor TaxID=45248 RepID=UPI0003B7A193|nr:hypothetical protein [Leucothrix mucor]